MNCEKERGIFNCKQKIIIKIGTKAIFDTSEKKIKLNVINCLAKNIQILLKKNWEIILVSSGAVGCGRNILKKGDGIGLKQAQASIGQIELMKAYSNIFSKYGVSVAQFLLSSEDLKNMKRFRNIKRAYNSLGKKVIPIINENDVTAIEELSFGDNDCLASEILIKLNFDVLLILTEKGALIKNKQKILNAKSFSVNDYDSFLKNDFGFGGLKSKLDAGKKAIKYKKKFIIGKAGDDLIDILNRNVPATFFNH